MSKTDNKHPPASVNASMMAAALHYASKGWYVFPAPPGEKKSYKSAEFSGGAKWGMTIDPKEIRRNFRKKEWRNANVAIVTGAKSGIFVIEADTKEGHGVDGLSSIEKLQAKHGPMPETRIAVSPSGSIHRYYKHPGKDIKIKNSASKIAPGVDVRGDGGMVIAPPSIKPGVGEYKWLNDKPIAEAPAWLVAAVTQTNDKPGRNTTNKQNVHKDADACDADACGQPGRSTMKVTTAAEQELFEACTAISDTDQGKRNATLNKLAFLLGQLVGQGRLDEQTVMERLTNAAGPIGLEADEVAKTINSAISAGKLKPRLPVIKVVGGQIARNVEHAEAELLASGIPLFQRGGILMQPVKRELAAADGKRTEVVLLRP